MRLLLVDDDEVLGSALRDHLVAHGHLVDWAKRLAPASDAVSTTSFDLILLDLNLPDGRGIDFLRALRGRGDDVFVIILSAMDQLAIRIDGLNAGADDYLVKPFDLRELIARVAAIGRRRGADPSYVVRIGSLSMDHLKRAASVDGKALDLTPREWAVLEALARHPGVTLSKAQLEDVLSMLGATVEGNTIEVYVSRLRKKIGHDLIQTTKGLGYQLAPR